MFLEATIVPSAIERSIHKSRYGRRNSFIEQTYVADLWNIPYLTEDVELIRFEVLREEESQYDALQRLTDVQRRRRQQQAAGMKEDSR